MKKLFLLAIVALASCSSPAPKVEVAKDSIAKMDSTVLVKVDSALKDTAKTAHL